MQKFVIKVYSLEEAFKKSVKFIKQNTKEDAPDEEYYDYFKKMLKRCKKAEKFNDYDDMFSILNELEQQHVNWFKLISDHLKYELDLDDSGWYIKYY